MNSPSTQQGSLSSELLQIIKNRNVASTRTRLKILKELNKEDKQYKEEKKKFLRLEAIQEILISEVNYLQQLEILEKFFIQPILQRKLLNHPLLNSLSDNVKILYNVGGELIAGLKHDSENIVKTFYKLAPFFKMYSSYAADHENVVDLFKTKAKDNSAFKTFLFNQETRPEVNQTLFSLLISPIQRVPRYQLLMKEVLKHTPNTHNEYKSLQACLVEIEKSTKHINDLVALSQERQKLIELQSCISTPINLIKPGRIIIKQGWLLRASRSGNTYYKRYFIVLNDFLLYCKGKPETSLRVCCILPLSKCTLTNNFSKLAILTCLNERFILFSKNNDMDEWIEAIQGAIKKRIEDKKTLQKLNSTRGPFRHSNVIQFQSDSVSQKCIKTKKRAKLRIMNEQTQLNSSNIMHSKENVNDDIQPKSTCSPVTDDDIEGQSTCSPFSHSINSIEFSEDEYFKADNSTHQNVENMKSESKRNNDESTSHECCRKLDNSECNAEALITKTKILRSSSSSFRTKSKGKFLFMRKGLLKLR